MRVAKAWGMRPIAFALVCCLALSGGAVHADGVKLSGAKLRATMSKAFAALSTDMGNAPEVTLGRVRALRRETTLGQSSVDVAYELVVRRPSKPMRTQVRTIRLDESTGKPVGVPIRYIESGIDAATMRTSPNEKITGTRDVGLAARGPRLAVEINTDRGIHRYLVPLDSTAELEMAMMTGTSEAARRRHNGYGRRISSLEPINLPK